MFCGGTWRMNVYSTRTSNTPGCQQWEDNVDYHGNDITSSSGISDADACNMLCVANDACSHWTFGKDSNYCWLKDSDAGREVQSNRISGPKCNKDWVQISTDDCWGPCGREGGLCEDFCGS